MLSSFAQRLGIPDLSSKLPPSAAQLTVLQSNQIKAVQKGGRVLKGLALLLTILVPALYVLAISLARDRRREALMQVGFGILLAGLFVFLARKLAVSVVTNSVVQTESDRPAARAVLKIATSMLSAIAGALAGATDLLLIFIWGPIPATHRPVGIIVFTVLALIGTEVLRRQIEREIGA